MDKGKLKERQFRKHGNKANILYRSMAPQASHSKSQLKVRDLKAVDMLHQSTQELLKSQDGSLMRKSEFKKAFASAAANHVSAQVQKSSIPTNVQMQKNRSAYNKMLQSMAKDWMKDPAFRAQLTKGNLNVLRSRLNSDVLHVTDKRDFKPQKQETQIENASNFVPDRHRKMIFDSDKHTLEMADSAQILPQISREETLTLEEDQTIMSEP